MFQANTYLNRRNRLQKEIKDGIILILGNVDSPYNYPDNIYHFRQDSSFLYYFGLDMPGLAGVIDVDNDKQILFGNDPELADVIWTGPLPSMQELGAKVGLEQTRSYTSLRKYLQDAMSHGREIHFLPPYRAENKIEIQHLLGFTPDVQKLLASNELVKAIVDMRCVKEEQEIAEMEKACEIGHRMHTTAMRLAHAGRKEAEIAGIMEGIAREAGGALSFSTILSQNGETLHNHDHSQILTEGRLMLTDAGAENIMHYASDHTRTTPVGGKFSQQQSEIYNIVLAAHQKATSLIKPEVTYLDIHREACKVLASGLKDLGIMKGNVDDAVMAGAHAMFMPHGLGHHIGIDVHDMEDFGQLNVGYDAETRPVDQFGTANLRMGRRLKEGFVVTNEPGCYFIPALIDRWKADKMHTDFINYDALDAYRTFGGIRLEDDILVTADSHRILGPHIPLTIEEVEAEVQKGLE